MRFLHGHQIEVWGLSDPFVQGRLFWLVICIVDLAFVERRRHVLVEVSAAEAALADVVAVVLGQRFVAHVEFVLEQRRQVFELPRCYLARRSIPTPLIS
jgi:hypothetical protein